MTGTLSRLPQFALRCLRSAAVRLMGEASPSPRAMCLYVTKKCNLRCRICGIWTEAFQQDTGEDLSLDDMKRIFSDPLFHRLEFVNINGGEPNLRADLPEIVDLCLRSFPRLEILTLNTNGLPHERTIQNVKRMNSLLRPANVSFSVSVSFHAMGRLCDDIAGRPGTFHRVMKTFAELKRLRITAGFHLSANCVISRLNISRLPEILEWGERENIPVNFTLGEVRNRFHNTNLADNVLVDVPDREALVRFLRTLGRSKKRFLQHALRYRHLADMIEHGRPRALSCHYRMAGLILGSDGSLFYCKDSPSLGNCLEASASSLYYGKENLEMRDKVLFRGKCASCPPNTFNRIEAERDILKILNDLLIPRRRTV
ncbi:MAG: radical SAM protein [Acidobacteriota bacterium]|nr:radical SAM protein [Acidobacteriota bacterium]